MPLSHNTRRVATALLLGAVTLGAYTVGYLTLRDNHDLIHRTTYHTDTDKHVVTHHRIAVGEWRGQKVQALAVLYWPARACEAVYWELRD